MTAGSPQALVSRLWCIPWDFSLVANAACITAASSAVTLIIHFCCALSILITAQIRTLAHSWPPAAGAILPPVIGTSHQLEGLCVHQGPDLFQQPC